MGAAPIQHVPDNLHFDSETISNERNISTRLRDTEIATDQAEVGMGFIESKTPGSAQAARQRRKTHTAPSN